MAVAAWRLKALHMARRMSGQYRLLTSRGQHLLAAWRVEMVNDMNEWE